MPAAEPGAVLAPCSSPELREDLVAHNGAVITHASESKAHRVAILDAGAQYGKVIDRRVRELCVQSDILPLNTPVAMLAEYGAIIISGGPQSVYGPSAPAYDADLFTVQKPILGICYGMQLINFVLGGKVEAKTIREDGQFPINIKTDNPLFANLPETIDVLLTHGDSVAQLSSECSVIGTTSEGLITAIAHTGRPIYGCQFHPEVDLTPLGQKIFLNFIENVAKLPRTFTLHGRLHTIAAEIREQVGEKKRVLLLLSGGVDSSVCAALIKYAIGAERMHCIHIDNGFMRLNESEKVYAALQAIGVPVTVLHSQSTFYEATTTIAGVSTDKLVHTLNPEHKRKIIGDTFMRVSNSHIASLQLDPELTLLAQGTLRPDLIESASHLASSNADVIKTHHNDTELVRQLRALGKIIEPLKDYHKDEVRQLGLELGLGTELVWRQPFPGPGLAIRIICANEPFRTDNDSVIVEKLKGYQTGNVNLTLLPCRTVGVQGDQRSYSSLVALSSDYDTVHAIDYIPLFAMAKSIPKHIHGINRVIFVYGSKLVQGQLLDITETYLTPDVIHQLQLADEIVNQILLKYDLIQKLSQVPVILFPVSFGVSGSRAICIRTFITNDFMTGVPAVPGRDLPLDAVSEMVTLILEKVPGISRVCFDLTSKPPATTEWE